VDDRSKNIRTGPGNAEVGTTLARVPAEKKKTKKNMHVKARQKKKKKEPAGGGGRGGGGVGGRGRGGGGGWGVLKSKEKHILVPSGGKLVVTVYPEKSA